jgi:hypothetical protein
MAAPIPSTWKGALHIILMGAGGALVALAFAQFFPSIIPAQATGVKL